MTIQAKKIRFYQAKDLNLLPQLANLSATDRLGMQAVATVLPFRANNYVVEELIDCTFCFRWPQFVGLDDLKFATRESDIFQDYRTYARALYCLWSRDRSHSAI